MLLLIQWNETAYLQNLRLFIMMIIFVHCASIGSSRRFERLRWRQWQVFAPDYQVCCSWLLRRLLQRGMVNVLALSYLLWLEGEVKTFAIGTAARPIIDVFGDIIATFTSALKMICVLSGFCVFSVFLLV